MSERTPETWPDRPTMPTREEALAQLAGSERGRSTIEHLVALLDGPGLGLDAYNQEAVLALLVHAWDRPSTRDLMRDAIGGAR